MALARMRVLHALAEIAGEEGLDAATVPRVCSLAGVSEQMFERIFSDREDCLRQAFEETAARARSRIRAAVDGEEACWEDSLRARLAALLAFLDEEPELARLCVTYALAGGPQMHARWRQVLDYFGRAVATAPRAGRPAEQEADLPAATVGAAVQLAEARLFGASPAPLRDLLGQLMCVLVRPYLGPDAALAELAREATAARCLEPHQPLAS
jgi:AcrR family transcriptional regulator